MTTIKKNNFNDRIRKWAKKGKSGEVRSMLAPLIIEANNLAKKMGRPEQFTDTLKKLENMDRPKIKEKKEYLGEQLNEEERAWLAGQHMKEQEKKIEHESVGPTSADLLDSVRRQVKAILRLKKHGQNKAMIRLAETFDALDLSTNLLYEWDHRKGVGCIWQKAFSKLSIKTLDGINGGLPVKYTS